MQKSSPEKAFDRLVFVAILILVFLMAARSPLDTDMWWHLRAGYETIHSGRPYLVDTLSYTRAGEKWINHEWLTEAGMYLIYRYGGLLAIGGWVALFAAISMGIFYLQMEGSSLLRAFIILLGSLVAATTWTARPQMCSLVLLALASYLLFLYKYRQKDYIWLLPLIFILWSNLHGGYILGFMVIGLMIAGETLNHLLRYPDLKILPWKKILKLVVIAVISVLVVLINPNGLDTWRMPFITITLHANQLVSEWASPDFHQLPLQPFLWLLFAIITGIAFSERRIDGTDLLILLWFTYMALLSGRNFGPFAMVSIPILSRYLTSTLSAWGNRLATTAWFSQVKNWINKNSRSSQKSKILNLIIISLLAMVSYLKLYAVTYPAFLDASAQSFFPTKAVAWIQNNHPAGRLFNEYNWGGYLDWSLRDYPVFLDARTELFNDEIVNQWVDVVQAKDGWQDILDNWHVNLILIMADRPLVKQLPEHGWKLQYQDELSVIFTRN